MIVNIWVHPHPVDAPIVSNKDEVFTGTAISIHRDNGLPVARTVAKGISEQDMAEVLRSMANELERE